MMFFKIILNYIKLNYILKQHNYIILTKKLKYIYYNNNQLSTTNYQLPIINYQLSITNYQISITNLLHIY